MSPDAGKAAPTWQTGIMKSLYENLSEPAPLEEGALRVIPLGGLGEVTQTHGGQQFAGALGGRLVPAVEDRGQQDVVEDRQGSQGRVPLGDETDALVTQARALLVAQ